MKRTPPDATPAMKRIVFLDQSVPIIFHTALVTSIYLLFVGHNQPGGGFVGGLVAGAAISLRYLAGGIDEVRGISRFQPWTILGAGIAISVGTGSAQSANSAARNARGSGTWPWGSAFRVAHQ